MTEVTNKIVFSDFDGTITKKDSYIRSLFFYSSTFKICILLPGLIFNLIKYFFGKITRNDMKEYSYKKFFSGVETSFIVNKNKEYIKKLRFNNKVVELLKTFRAEGFKIILVTASPDTYIGYFAKELGYDGLICTKVEEIDGRLTGNLIGMNCNNEEKVKRIKESEYYTENSQIITLGNSKGDHAMLGLSDEYYYVIKGIPVKNAKLN
ncbi:MAG: HAD-IB family phosphatase [Candidatus Delongbacteria bacterium]|nr:HAD-IB family phosphatase [Candidatus Delongbacteria bacterium]